MLTNYPAETKDESTTAFQIRRNFKVSTAKTIFSSELAFHKATWPKGVCTCDQVTQGKVSTVFDIVCCVGRQRGERRNQTRDADKNFFLCYSNKKYIHTEI